MGRVVTPERQSAPASLVPAFPQSPYSEVTTARRRALEAYLPDLSNLAVTPNQKFKQWGLMMDAVSAVAEVSRVR